MDLIKQYITQSLTAASNNLRLTNHQLEALGLLREALINSEDLGADIDKMKKITELSTLAIRLNEIHDFLSHRKIDFFKFSDQFKEHSRFLINDLTNLLAMDNPASIKAAINKLNGSHDKNDFEKVENIFTDENKKAKPVEENLSSAKTITHKENVDGKKDFFNNFEKLILKPVKHIDDMLNQFATNEINFENISYFAQVMKKHGELSEKNGFQIISDMHMILHQALVLIKSRILIPGKNVIESMRACLIVIVAVVREKEVDIKKYLNKAEDFEKEIQTFYSKELN